MIFYLIGIDHKVAPIGIREIVYWKRPHIAEFLAKQSVGRTATLSTCNRFEIYGIAENETEARLAAGLLKNRFDPIFDNSYTAYGAKNVFRHLVSLAAGLESHIRGELEIYGQLGAWAGREDFPKELGRLVHQALLAGLKIRAEADLNRPENNIAALLYKNLLEYNRSDDLLNVAVAGTGKIAELFACYKPQGVRLCFAAHKNILRAGELAGIAAGTAVLFKELPRLLLSADILISATSSPHRIFDKNYFSRIASTRTKELHIYDLAVPRDVEPAVKDIGGIVLKNIDEVMLNDSDVNSWDAAKQIGH